ncbi:MAG: flagellar basal body P-ring protein FlgI [Bacteroidota bacterium]|nr:flagellar basal body P-ring protein FlgI [Rhodothermia bacterium]MCS7156071.1 flagellar basal body P-ring protein FlgI [Bacteroidota bacterium]MDW8137888.1 flagellar basal body P-ring protein FlgI [Bacteroidota bacterium]MDW8286261.1 flagellar basal body P-ring protein FlgI [Bacteroidota bacterium]
MKALALRTALMAALLLLLGSAPRATAQGQSRIKDVALLQGVAPVELIGYGLVTGLDRTGDRTLSRRGGQFTVQAVANMLRHFGIAVDPNLLVTRNVAAVMVTAELSPLQPKGSRIDVTVSSLGDATSLFGGVLLLTPLINPADGQVYATAQGPLVVGGIQAEAAVGVFSSRTGRNHVLTGRVIGGGVVQRDLPLALKPEQPVRFLLKEPDLSTAHRIAEAINKAALGAQAKVLHGGAIEVAIEAGRDWFGTLAAIEALPVAVDAPARVVINERTGTVVAGGEVRIGPAMVAHGNIRIQTQVTPAVSQPAPFSPQGQTVVVPVPESQLREEPGRVFVLQPNTTVADLAAALNAVGVSPRDIVAIFQALARAGALRAEIVVL